MIPFRLLLAAYVCSAMADPLEWCMCQRGVVGITNYLTNFIIISLPAPSSYQVCIIACEHECAALGMTLDPEKKQGPTARVVFPGIDVDAATGHLSFLVEK